MTARAGHVLLLVRASVRDLLVRLASKAVQKQSVRREDFKCCFVTVFRRGEEENPRRCVKRAARTISTRCLSDLVSAFPLTPYMQQSSSFLVAAASAAAVCYVLYRRKYAGNEQDAETAQIRRVLSMSRHMNAGA